MDSKDQAKHAAKEQAKQSVLNRTVPKNKGTSL